MNDWILTRFKVSEYIFGETFKPTGKVEIIDAVSIRDAVAQVLRAQRAINPAAHVASTGVVVKQASLSYVVSPLV